MAQHGLPLRLTATAALSALLLDTMLLPVAIAQSAASLAPPSLPVPGAGRPDLNQGDPPERVGRIASLTGAVSFHNLGDTQWSTASLNYPVSNGNAFWTEPSSDAQLEVSASWIAMAPTTEFDVANLDASGLQGVAAQGEIYLRLRDLSPNEVWLIQTPRGLVRLGGTGRYDILVGTTDQPTLVGVVEGAARIEGPGLSLHVAAGQMATLTGTDPFQGAVGALSRSPFLAARLAAERPAPAPVASVPVQEVYAMAGGSDLQDTGSWSEAPAYGRVWYPPVPASWVPYREGHWAYVTPWGWTWIDDAPWGFAPFHYGRWVQIDNRWAWTPGAAIVAQRPVYAPALVTFVGIGAGVALGAALASGSVGWVPLGPREPYHPWYHASNSYVRQVNVAHVTNITNTNTNVTINNYINRAGATTIPAAAMIASRPVQAVARPITPQEFAAARPIAGQQPLRPAAATAGITPVIARRLNLTPAPVAPAAPGPVVRAQAVGPSGFNRPTIVPGLPGAAPNQPAAPVVRPNPARPEQIARDALRNDPHPSQLVGVPPNVPQPNGIRPEGARQPNTPGTEPPHHPAVPAPAPQAGQPNAPRPDAVHLPASPVPAPALTAAMPARPAVVPHPTSPSLARPEAAPAPPHPVQPVPQPVHPAPQPAPHQEAPPVFHPAPQPTPQSAPRIEMRTPPPVAPRPAPAAMPRPEPPRAAPRPQEQPRPQERKPNER